MQILRRGGVICVGVGVVIVEWSFPASRAGPRAQGHGGAEHGSLRAPGGSRAGVVFFVEPEQRAVRLPDRVRPYLARTRATPMDHPGIRRVVHAEAGPVRAQTPVDVVEEQREPDGVHRADGFQRLPGQQQARCHRLRRRPGAVVIEERHPVRAEAAATGKYARQAQNVPQQRARRREAAHRVLGAAVFVDEARGHGGRVGARPEKSGESVERAGRHQGVRVQ
jgi:hypothetical protein